MSGIGLEVKLNLNSNLELNWAKVVRPSSLLSFPFSFREKLENSSVHLLRTYITHCLLPVALSHWNLKVCFHFISCERTENQFISIPFIQRGVRIKVETTRNESCSYISLQREYRLEIFWNNLYQLIGQNGAHPFFPRWFCNIRCWISNDSSRTIT